METSAAPSLYKGHRFPAEIISHCVWLYYRFPLSYRDIQEMMLNGRAVYVRTFAGAGAPSPALDRWRLRPPDLRTLVGDPLSAGRDRDL